MIFFIGGKLIVDNKLNVLFCIHDLGKGGAEKVLINLINNMSIDKFNITLLTLFSGGVNEKYIKPHIKYVSVWNKEIKGNSKIMKLFSSKRLHARCIKKEYDIEIAFLEGPTTRIISGCPSSKTKLVSWIHGTYTLNEFCQSYRSVQELEKSYKRFNQIVCVSNSILHKLDKKIFNNKNCSVVYNYVEYDEIIKKSKENVDIKFDKNVLNIISIGSLKKIKGFDRLLRIVLRLKNDGNMVTLRILGIGNMERELKKYVKDNNLEETVFFMGYQENPYKYLANSDLFVCSSYSEGFSTATTESLIVGTPVCTVDVSGMKEMLGENNEFGFITDNSEGGLYNGIKKLIENEELLKYYKDQALKRREIFRTEKTVKEVENLLLNLAK